MHRLADGDKAQLRRRTRAVGAGGAEVRAVQQRAHATAQVAPPQPFHAHEGAQAEGQGEQRRRRRRALGRLDDFFADLPGQHRNDRIRARAHQADASRAARQHLFGMRRLRGSVGHHVHRFPVHLRLHQQTHLAQQHRQSVGGVDPRRGLDQRFERYAEVVIAAGQVEQRQARRTRAEVAVEGRAQPLQLFGRAVGGEGQHGLRLEAGLQRGQRVGLPAQHRAEGRFGKLHVEVAHAPARAVGVGQGRLCQSHVEQQPRRALLGLRGAAAAADEGHAPRRVQVQVEVFECEAQHRLPVELGGRRGAGDTPQAAGLGNQRQRIGDAFEHAGLATGGARQIPAVGDGSALQCGDVGAAAPAGVTQAGKLVSAEAQCTTCRSPQRHIGRDAGTGAPALEFQAAGIGAEHRVAPDACAAAAGESAGRAIAQQQADGTAVRGFTGLSRIGAGQRQGPQRRHHLRRALELKHGRSVRGDRPVGSCAGAGIGEHETDGVAARHWRTECGVEVQFRAEAGEAERAFHHCGSVAVNNKSRRQRDSQGIAVGAARLGCGCGLRFQFQRPRHCGSRQQRATRLHDPRRFAKHQAAARHAQGHIARRFGHQAPGQQPHRAGGNVEALRIVRVDLRACRQQHRFLDDVRDDDRQLHEHRAEGYGLEEGKLHQREVSVDEGAEQLRRPLGSRLFAQIRLRQKAQPHAGCVEVRSEFGACLGGGVDGRVERRIRDDRQVARVLLDQHRGQEAPQFRQHRGRRLRRQAQPGGECDQLLEQGVHAIRPRSCPCGI